MRRSWWLAVGLVVSVWAASPALAGSGDADGTFTVIVEKIEISPGDGTFVTVFSGSSSLNIAAANAGAVAAGLVSGKAVPPGHYNVVRVTIGSTIRVKGYVNSGANTLYTDGGTDGGAFTSIAGNDNTTAADYTASTFTVPAENRVKTDSLTFTCTKGGPAPTVRISFDTSGVINTNPGLNPPTITYSTSS